jgi:hypothetical protein
MPRQGPQSPDVSVEPEAEARKRPVVVDRKTMRGERTGCERTAEERQGRGGRELRVIDDQPQVVAAEFVPQCG